MNKSECKLDNYFTDAIDKNYHKAVYCLKNCGLKCDKPYTDNAVKST
jgi:hypothetical protein